MRYNRVEGQPQPPPSNHKTTNTMKIHYASIALLAGVSVAFSSCVAPSAGYVSYSAPAGGISTGVAWTNASYDADGFPIFGYSYGRPVYGYTAAGAAIFTIAALTALCYVPHWGPASWYHGHYHYPHGIHRVPQPPRYPAGHAPHVRPPAGAHSGPGMPKHAMPKPGVNRPVQVRPQQPSWNRPGAVHHPQQNGHIAPPQQGNRHPMGNVNKGGANPLPAYHKAGKAPSSSHPGNPNNGGIATLPARPGGSPVAFVPNRPSGNHGGAVTFPAQANRPVASAPFASSAGRPSSSPARLSRSNASHPISHGGGRAVGRR